MTFRGEGLPHGADAAGGRATPRQRRSSNIDAQGQLSWTSDGHPVCRATGRHLSLPGPQETGVAIGLGRHDLDHISGCCLAGFCLVDLRQSAAAEEREGANLYSATAQPQSPPGSPAGFESRSLLERSNVAVVEMADMIRVKRAYTVASMIAAGRAAGHRRCSDSATSRPARRRQQ